ncbi:hypothetical protein PR048_022328, partial [Dryococelus australis]
MLKIEVVVINAGGNAALQGSSTSQFHYFAQFYPRRKEFACKLIYGPATERIVNHLLCDYFLEEYHWYNNASFDNFASYDEQVLTYGIQTVNALCEATQEADISVGETEDTLAGKAENIV